MNWQYKRFDALSAAELYQILQLRSEVFVVEQQCIYPDIDGKDADAIHLYCSDRQTIIAYARILPAGSSYPEVAIGRVVVSAAVRGQKLARPLMQQAMELALREFNTDTIKVQAQAYLADFYRSLGFVAQSEIYLEDGIPHLDMLYQKK